MPLEINPVKQESNRHKHADLIIAWANGAKIQTKTADGWAWVDVNPSWFLHHEYRIKPKEPLVRYSTARCHREGKPGKQMATYWSVNKTTLDNIKATFDPDTLECLSVELIK